MIITSHRKEIVNSFNQSFYKIKIKGFQLKKFEKARIHLWLMITNHHTKITTTCQIFIREESILRMINFRMCEVIQWLNIKINLIKIKSPTILDLLIKIEIVYHWKKSFRIHRIATLSLVYKNLKINWRMNLRENWRFPTSKSMKESLVTIWRIFMLSYKKNTLASTSNF